MVYNLKSSLTYLSLSVLVSTVTSHMMMSSPSPRRAKGNPNYPESMVDYSMTSPLGPGVPFPCRGYGAGGSSGTYQAGSSIPVTLSGGASHNGGHCQFSISYDDSNFAVLKTVFGTCMIDSLSYSVDLPKDMPNGKATLAWSWINKTGNREYYMNCADITISGGTNGGKVSGPRMVVANINGGPTFPENFANDYGKAQYYDSAPIITVSPNGYSTDPQIPVKPPTKPTDYPTPVPQPTTSSKPSLPNPPSSSYVQNPKPSNSPPPASSSSSVVSKVPTYPTNTPPPNNGNCKTGDSQCGPSGLQICSNNLWYSVGCAPSTVCKVINSNQAQCTWKY